MCAETADERRVRLAWERVDLITREKESVVRAIAHHRQRGGAALGRIPGLVADHERMSVLLVDAMSRSSPTEQG